VAPIVKLSGHSRYDCTPLIPDLTFDRKVGHVLFNPSAENILATSSGDFTTKIWDIEAGTPRLNLKHNDIVQSLSWSANGALLVTTSRDKKLRIWDVRQEQAVHVGPGHTGAKNSRAVWMGEHDRIATTGFSKMSDRQLGLWDIRSPAEPINGFEMLDSISGVCMPFWDDSTQCLYLAGKGDGNIRYYEYENDKFEYLSEYKSADPQRGVAFMPKRGINVHENEVMRGFKTVNDSYIEPISFIVPRRAEVFQNDIYPPVTGSRPGMSLDEYFGGKDALPPKIDLESVYNNEAPVEVPSDYKPSVPLTPAKLESAAEPVKPASKPEPVQPTVQKSEPVQTPVSKPEPVKEPVREPIKSPVSMKEQGVSMASMAAKFADKDSDEESFEEVAKPEKVTSAEKAAMWKVSHRILNGDNSY
jgi:coronin-1B/1C/6